MWLMPRSVHDSQLRWLLLEANLRYKFLKKTDEVRQLNADIGA